jgi:hypothetical protein
VEEEKTTKPVLSAAAVRRAAPGPPVSITSAPVESNAKNVKPPVASSPESEEEEQEEEFVNPISSSKAESVLSSDRPNSSQHSSQGVISPPPPKEEERRSSLIAVKTKENMPSLGGLNYVSKQSVDVPSELMARIFLQDEIAIGQFDVFFPEKKLSIRMRFYLTLFTLGLYQVYLFFSYLFGLIRHACCGSCKECDDEIHFSRGKIIVTNKGRLIAWQTSLTQSNFYDRKTYSHVHSKTQIFHVDDIAQTSLVYSDRLLCLNCCCHDYSTGIDISFYRFQRSNSPSTPFLAIRTLNYYLDFLRMKIADKFVSTNKSFSSFGETDRVTIRILSNPDDHIYDGEYALEPLEDLTKFHHKLNEMISNSRMQYNASQFADLNTAYGFSGSNGYHEHGQRECNPGVFLSNKAAMDIEQAQKYGGSIHTVMHGVKEVHPDLSNFSLVDDSGNVVVPKQWVPLSPGEEIVCAMGHGYHMTTCDYFVSFLTLGWYYFRWLRPHVIRRTAYVLTTHRIVEILLVHNKGKVPAELGRMDITVRCYFPKEILSGFMEAHGLTINSTLLTAHGTISMQIPSNHLIFAQKMQLTTSRYPKVPIENIADLENNILNQEEMMKLQDPFNLANPFQLEPEQLPLKEILDFSERKFFTDKLTSSEKLLYPLLPGEELLYRFQSGASYLPFGWVGCGNRLSKALCTFFYENPNRFSLFSLVNLVKCATCCHRPLVEINSSVVTNRTFFYMKTPETTQELIEENILEDKLEETVSNSNPMNNVAANNPGDVESPAGENKNRTGKRSSTQPLDAQIGKTVLRTCGNCCGNESQYYLYPFLMIWVPIHTIRSQEMTILSSGAKPYQEKCTCCVLTPRSFQARYHLNVDTKIGLSFPFAEDFPYKSWKKDRRLTGFSNTIGAIQSFSHSQCHQNMV